MTREILLFHPNSAHADAVLFVDLINETNLPDRKKMNPNHERAQKDELEWRIYKQRDNNSRMNRERKKGSGRMNQSENSRNYGTMKNERRTFAESVNSPV